ncbi:MAG: tetraacyldisaccharide 4'-kinase [Deltaproteobacteria bacterium]
MSLRRYFLALATDEERGPAASLVKLPLYLLSLVYSLFIRALAAVRGARPFRPALKVISVGNITLGGTGKTVLVAHIARSLIADGRKTAVVSRGYGRPLRGDDTDFGRFGDEAGMLKRSIPGLEVIISADRVKGCGEAALRGCEAVILDDGFQQWGITKDLDIVCVDARGFGNSCLIPRGTLREPLSALRRADAFVLTNCNLAGDTAPLERSLAALNDKALIVRSEHASRGIFRQGREARPGEVTEACLVCGIGNPASFFESCRSSGIRPSVRLAFPDHHRYGEEDASRIIGACRENNIKAVVTTEKDWMRLPIGRLEAEGIAVYSLRVALRIKGNEDELTGRLRRLFTA